MDIDAYLNRINYVGTPTPTADCLRELHLAHLQSVPFENLSIHSGEEIVLEDEALFDKIVRRHRGGFCYELNGIFAALLRSLGFDVEMISAQVANSESVFGADFDHMALVVSLDQRWLADVGFGDSFLAPLLLDERGIQTEGTRDYQIVSDGAYRILMQRAQGGDWKAQYRFTLQPYAFEDYAEMCRYHQTSPNSHFTKARLCSLATPAGRVTLSGMRLITTASDGGKSEVELESVEVYTQLLREHFGIELADPS